LKQTLRIATLQFADDVADVAAGTEGAAGASYHHDAHIIFRTQLRKESGEFVIHLERDCVETLRPIQGNRRNAVALFVEKRFRVLH
jgi:hypothetical protein